MPLDPSRALGLSLPFWSALPFAGFLLSLAAIPLARPGWWARHYGKVALAYGLPVAGWFLWNAPAELGHAASEYVSFLVLLGALFTISGGILVRGSFRATPGINAAFLVGGSVLANVLGTTGAAMLLLRPLLRANAHRKRCAHVVVFFIFTVANIGGSLTPVGDPPLFLGFLRGVPFFWPARALWPLWLFTVGAVAGIFLLVDLWFARQDGAGEEPNGEPVPLSIDGKVNFPLLAPVIGAVFLPAPWREIAMAASAALSAWLTPRAVRDENGFTWHPIKEVAILFAAIFATMIPALLILKSRGGELGLSQPWQFFWATGSLSSFLDNAPTYLTFFSLAQGMGDGSGVAGVAPKLLAAISAGAVFMGANSYIGNAPNFMVKAIAEESGLRMPSFPGYMAWSCAVLVPVFVLATLLFF
jgi:Na+/H+ antiporter NhaD/arsenite permease-like protein